jgi:glucosylceramidase
MVRHASWLGWDVTGGPGATGTGTKVQLWGVGSPAGTNQQWKPVALGGGWFRFVARHSGKCLDVPGQSRTNGTQLQQWDCNGTVAQSFRLIAQP